jgi:hypothetical protein
MASTVNLPLVGPVSKNVAVSAAVVFGGGAVYVVYKMEKAKKAAAAATAAATAATAQSSAAYAYGYGSGGTYPGGYYGYGSEYGYGGTPGGAAYYAYGVGTPTGAAMTNAAWAQAAINQLTQEGYNAQTVSAALGAYLTGQPIPAGGDTIVSAAIGIEGYPPQEVPPMQVGGTTGGGTGGGQTAPAGGTVTVPSVIGLTGTAAWGRLQNARLGAQLESGATGSTIIKSQTPSAGSSAAPGSVVMIS